jgi:hypothetical protein
MEKVNNWEVICGHQENGILLLGTRERNRIVMEMDAGAVGVGVLNKGLGRGMIIVLGTLSRRVLSWLYSRKAIPPTKILCTRRP